MIGFAMAPFRAEMEFDAPRGADVVTADRKIGTRDTIRVAKEYNLRPDILLSPQQR
jgi:hypothetical protein